MVLPIFASLLAGYLWLERPIHAKNRTLAVKAGLGQAIGVSAGGLLVPPGHWLEIPFWFTMPNQRRVLKMQTQQYGQAVDPAPPTVLLSGEGNAILAPSKAKFGLFEYDIDDLWEQNDTGLYVPKQTRANIDHRTVTIATNTSQEQIDVTYRCIDLWKKNEQCIYVPVQKNEKEQEGKQLYIYNTVDKKYIPISLEKCPDYKNNQDFSLDVGQFDSKRFRDVSSKELQEMLAQGYSLPRNTVIELNSAAYGVRGNDPRKLLRTADQKYELV
ncbi:MAG: hypothetical protein HY832_00235 [Candidatus Aenigmarchaeota archaeon]|nr:hypothetical protein [Candidatus Aenigmarchaeota archaeon]